MYVYINLSLTCTYFYPWQGPYFAPPYEPLPPDVQFSYNGQPMELSEKAEEAAGFFAKMLDHDYTKKDIFCKNFFEDWRKVSIPATITVYTYVYTLL